MHYGNTRTPSMHLRLGSTTLSQLAFPGESNPNFAWTKCEWDKTVIFKNIYKGKAMCTKWKTCLWLWRGKKVYTVEKPVCDYEGERRSIQLKKLVYEGKGIFTKWKACLWRKRDVFEVEIQSMKEKACLQRKRVCREEVCLWRGKTSRRGEDLYMEWTTCL